MESQVKYGSLSQPPSIHASPINYNRTCNTAYNSPIGTSYNQINSPYRQIDDNYQFQNNYQQQAFNQQQQFYPLEQQYNLSTPTNFTNSNYQPQTVDQQAAAFGSNYPINYSLNNSPFQIADTVDPYHYAQHPLPHSLHNVSQAQTHGFPFYDDPGRSNYGSTS